MKKLGLLGEVIEQFQLTPQEIIENFVNHKVVSSKFLEEMAEKAKSFENISFISSKQFVTPPTILPGMFYYSDGTFSAEIIEGRQISGVVGDVSGSEALVVTLRQRELPWSSDWLRVKETQGMISGKKATKAILMAAREQKKGAEAAEWCDKYAEDNVNRGEAFLSSDEELTKQYANQVIINTSLKALNAPLLKGGYWSSNECYNNYAWILGMGNGLRGYGYKDNYYYVRPVLAIKI